MPWQESDDRPGWHTAAWRRARLAALQRAHWRCELRLDGCTGAATQVDHTLGIAADPTHQHLQATCTPCHRRKTAQQGKGFRRAAADPPPTPRTTW